MVIIPAKVLTTSFELDEETYTFGKKLAKLQSDRQDKQLPANGCVF